MLKNLKSLFFTEDPSEDTTEEVTKTEEATNSTVEKETSASSNAVTTSQVPLQNTTNQASTTGSVDAKIVEKLLKAIESNNLEGFDYLEYKKSLKALEKMPMDEATKYRSAFATAATLGVTLDKLMESSNFYIDILDKEKEKFIGAFKSQFNDKVSEREKEVTQFESVIKEKSTQIQKLTQEITNHQKQILELKTKIDASNAKISKTQNDFKQSHNHLKSQFEEDKVKMQKYLK